MAALVWLTYDAGSHAANALRRDLPASSLRSPPSRVAWSAATMPGPVDCATHVASGSLSVPPPAWEKVWIALAGSLGRVDGTLSVADVSLGALPPGAAVADPGTVVADPATVVI